MTTQAAALPSYAPMLKAFHREFARELRSMITKLPIHAGAQVLEIATGDGKFAIWLDEMVGRAGSVTAVDISSAWLSEASRNVDRSNASDIDLERADATKLPYKDETFDFVWCAQSLYSLPRINACLAEMQRVLRPGGRIALLENDSLHHILLPWPVDLELHILAAELKHFQATASRPAKFYAGRWLSRLLRQAKFVRPQERSFAFTRQQPLSAHGEEYFQSFLHSLRERVEACLKPKALRRLDRLIDPDSRHCMWKQPDFVAVCIERVVWAEKR
ncbi:class I SAM-dependent methyltransferase [Anatilimnocola floriformis]|uniref:class I SAM-dependent methyltransferase n=1 Tax=Anatilimnocola floriformis TaxID=2948575 RepID=UPI0020C333EB|nr:methyltransferase domain-containing protein [Anatilimnocola floriformis]